MDLTTVASFVSAALVLHGRAGTDGSGGGGDGGARLGGRTLALAPGALAWELDAELASVGPVELAGHGRGIGAHPQVDPITGALHIVSHGDVPAHHIVASNSQTRITSPVSDAPGPLQDLLLTRERLVLIGEGFIGITDSGGQATTWWAAAGLPVPSAWTTSPASSPPTMWAAPRSLW